MSSKMITAEAMSSSPGSRNKWNKKMFKIMGAKHVSAKGMNWPLKSKIPQMTSMLLMSLNKYMFWRLVIKERAFGSRPSSIGKNSRNPLHPNTKNINPNNKRLPIFML